MDLWDVIIADHEHLKQLCHEIIAANGSDPGARDRLFEQFHEDLERHLTAEEEVLYRALERDERSRADAMMGAGEHDEIRARLEGLAAHGRTGSREWTDMFESLMHYLERHFRLEEQGVLVTARGVLDPDLADSLMWSFERAKNGTLRSDLGGLSNLTAPLAAVLLGALAGAAAAFIFRPARRDAMLVESSHEAEAGEEPEEPHLGDAATGRHMPGTREAPPLATLESDPDRRTGQSLSDLAAEAAPGERTPGENLARRQEALLDEAVEETFPASDPIAPKRITK